MKFFLSISIIILFGGLFFNYFNDDFRKINILREREYIYENFFFNIFRKCFYDFVKC